MSTCKGLVERLNDGETILVAEGYVIELAARGLLSLGAFVPEVVLDQPDSLRQLHREFAWAGSDVVVAFTYYAHREKLTVIGREPELEALNRTALKIAREVADETGTLMAASLSASTIYLPDDPSTHQEAFKMFEEQVKWAVEGGADFIIGETFGICGEAELALKAIKEFGNGLPAVINLASHTHGLFDNVPLAEACQRLEQGGAAVVGLNCTRGPKTLPPVLEEVRAACKGPIAALPVCYRTDEKHPSWHNLYDMDGENPRAFPLNLGPWQCSTKNIADFTEKAKALGVQYMGLCCGNRPYLTRTMAETLGRKPPASKYRPNMSQHFLNISGSKRDEFKKYFIKNAIGNEETKQEERT